MENQCKGQTVEFNGGCTPSTRGGNKRQDRAMDDGDMRTTQKILGIRPFVDRVNLAFRNVDLNDLPKEAAMENLMLMHQLQEMLSCEVMVGYTKFSKIRNAQGYYKFTTISLLQPYDGDLEIMQEFMDQKFSTWWITRVEFAVDYMVRTAGDAQEVENMFCRYFHKTHVRGEKSRFNNIQKVLGKKSRGSYVVGYSDRFSKLTDSHCFHLEWRAIGSPALKRLGIGNMYDIIELDHRQFWSTRLLFKGINMEKLGRTILRYLLVNANDEDDAAKKFLGKYYGCQGTENLLPFQTFYEGLRGIVNFPAIEREIKERCVYSINTRDLLPQGCGCRPEPARRRTMNRGR